MGDISGLLIKDKAFYICLHLGSIDKQLIGDSSNSGSFHSPVRNDGVGIGRPCSAVFEDHRCNYSMKSVRSEVQAKSSEVVLL
jgi:predicted hotdog family 3-hydroxylacyl-ACP dehydratase